MTKKLSKIHQRVAEASSKTQNELIDRRIARAMSKDLSSDESMLASITQTWDELNDLKKTLAETIMMFASQFGALTGDPSVMNALALKPESVAEFNKTIETIQTDLTFFSAKVKELRVQHEERTGRFQTIEDYSLFSRLSIEYQNAVSDLNTLLAPTITSVILLVNDCLNAKQAADLADPNVVSDVTPKEPA